MPGCGILSPKQDDSLVYISVNRYIFEDENEQVIFFFKSYFVLTLLQIFSYMYSSIDLFSLYILFSHFRPRDATRGNSFFQMSSYARANLRITNEKTKGKFP